MNEQPGYIQILGLEVAFRQEADLARIKEAAEFLEERYALRKKGMHGMQGKDNVLILVALELAVELLQLKDSCSHAEKSIEELLEKIEKSL